MTEDHGQHLETESDQAKSDEAKPEQTVTTAAPAPGEPENSSAAPAPAADPYPVTASDPESAPEQATAQTSAPAATESSEPTVPTESTEPAVPTESTEPTVSTDAQITETSVTPGPDVAPTAPSEPVGKPTPQPGRDRRARGQRPGRPGARPGRPGAAPVAPALAPTVEPVVEPVDPHKWGRIDQDGVVYVYSTSGERPVGNWQAGDVEAGLAHFGRRFDDFVTEIALLETRLATGSGDPKQAKAHALELREGVETLAAIGDFDSAAARLEVVIGAAETAIAGASQARAAARARAVAAKEALCVEAEQLAESTAWKVTGDRLKSIVDEWRSIHGIDRKTDDALWKRFAKARDAFTRRRGTHFADLDKQRATAKQAKEALIARAEALADSTEWGRTAGEYRTLMDEWKASGRAPREVEDELWNRFRAAQERFFSRRNKTFSERDAEFEANAAAKERLLAEAEAIDARDVEAARAALRSVRERWEAAGKVPRERIRELDNRLRAVEDRVQRAEDAHWRRTDPETAARVEQFRSRVEAFQAQAAKARAAGDERRAKQAEAQAAQWAEWLAAAERAVD